MAQIAKERPINFKPTLKTLQNIEELKTLLATKTNTDTIETALEIAVLTLKKKSKKTNKISP